MKWANVGFWMMLTGRGDGGDQIFCPSAKWAKEEEGENAKARLS